MIKGIDGMTINNLFLKFYFLLVFIIFFNISSACLGETAKNYDVRIINDLGNLQEDEKDNEKASESKLTKAMEIIKFIPGISLIIPSISCLTKAGLSGFEPADALDVSGALGRIFTDFTIISNISNVNASSTKGILALQEVFSSNLYCKYQKIYSEEDDYISKSKADNSEGGYPMFPIYPILIPIKNGQCDVGDDVVMRNFKKMSDLNSIDTKCSFSFSATDDQCLQDINIPILIENFVQEPVVEVACLAASLKGVFKKAGKKITNKKVSNKAEEMAKKKIEEGAKESFDEIKEKEMKKLREKISENFEDAEGLSQKKLENKINELKGKGDSITKDEKELLELGEELLEEAKSKATSKVVIDSLLGGLNVAASGNALFTDDRLANDPINLIAVLMIQSTFEIITNVLIDLLSLDFDCVIARLAAAQAVQYAAQITVTDVANKNYKKAKKSLPKYKFCGYDWLSYNKNWTFFYQKNEDEEELISNSKEIETYPRRGANDGSYYKKLIDGIKDGSIQNDITDKRFREYIYGGKEYNSGIPELSDYTKDINGTSIDYDPDYCIDPRISELSGIDYLSYGADKGNIYQKYYMRGNDKSNFACNRFFYDGHSGCVVPGKAIGIDRYTRSDTENIYNRKDILTGFNYYEISGENAVDVCSLVFDMARKCCKYRSKHLVCIEKIADEDKKDNEPTGTFCFSHVIDGYNAVANSVLDFLKKRDSDKYGPTCKLDGLELEATKKVNTDYVCVYSYGLCPYNFKLNAGLNYKASFCDSNVLEDFIEDKEGYLKRTPTHFNIKKCREGLFSKEKLYEYMNGNKDETVGKFLSDTFKRVKNDMKGFNDIDFETIYNINKNVLGDAKRYVEMGYEEVKNKEDETKVTYQLYNIIPNSSTKTDFYGKIKNLCQYRAHCVEVEKEENFINDDNITGSLFLDSSCTGRTSNSRNISPGHTGGITTQFSAPITECIFESFKNLVNGIAGVSLCSSDSPNNSDGYCGLDDENTIKTHIKNNDYAYFDLKYKKIDGVHIIKGQRLPNSYNPFYRIQKYLITTIKAALALFLVIFFYKKLLLGDLESFTKPENIPKLVFLGFKFSIVIWLIFYNGWQQGVYDKIIDFATASYSFVNNIFVRSVKNPKNQMLNLSGEDKVLRVVEVDKVNDKEEKIMLCLKYNMLDNVTYSRRDIETKRCEKGFYSNYKIRIGDETDLEKEYANIIVRKANKKERRTNEHIIISNNQELSQLIYYVDTYNDKNINKLKIEIKAGDGWNELKGSDLWNSNYDGCYFDTTEYKDSKNYLAAFDTLDCKLTRYLGYSVNMAAPNIIIYSAIMLIPSFFFPDSIITKVINGIGSLIFGLMMTFIFMIFNIVLKAVYTFTSAFFNLSILILLSPIILPLMFSERTKNVFDNWLEYVMDSIFKPVFNFASLVIYVNLMDIIMLKDVIFNNHSNKGRGANLVCPDGSSSFVCLINGIPGVQQISVLVNSNFISVIIDIVIVFAFFMLSDQLLTDVENIANSIFRNLSGDKQSSSALNASGTPMGKGVKESLGSAMATGAKLEEIRHDYINSAPGALFDKAKEARRDMFEKGKIKKLNKPDIDKSDDNKPGFLDRINPNRAPLSYSLKLLKDKNKRANKAIDRITAVHGNRPTMRNAAKILGYAAKGVVDSRNALSSTIAVAGESLIRGAGLIGRGIEETRKFRDKITNRVNNLTDHYKRVAAFSARKAWDSVTFKDYRNYKRAKYLADENSIIYRKKVKNDEKIRDIENRISKIKEEIEKLDSEEEKNNQKTIERKRLIEKLKKNENKKDKLKNAKVRKTYKKNIKFIKEKLTDEYKSKFIDETKKSIDRKENRYRFSGKRVDAEGILKNIDTLKQLGFEKMDEDSKDSDKTQDTTEKESNKEFLERHSKFLEENINRLKKAKFENTNRLGKKRRLINKMKRNIKILKHAGLKFSKLDEDFLREKMNYVEQKKLKKLDDKKIVFFKKTRIKKAINNMRENYLFLKKLGSKKMSKRDKKLLIEKIDYINKKEVIDKLNYLNKNKFRFFKQSRIKSTINKMENSLKKFEKLTLKSMSKESKEILERNLDNINKKEVIDKLDHLSKNEFRFFKQSRIKSNLNKMENSLKNFNKAGLKVISDENKETLKEDLNNINETYQDKVEYLNEDKFRFFRKSRIESANEIIQSNENILKMLDKKEEEAPKD